jgi:hypothetical protein
MEPVVNGIEEEFSHNLAVLRLDANQKEGLAAFRYYRLQGHPAFVLLDNQGEVLWTGLGVQEAETIKFQIRNEILP